MPPIPLTPELLRRAEEALSASRRHDEAMNATEIGRNSVRLRTRATELTRLGDEMGAHALFVQAADLFAGDDDSEAAAASAFDLAESLRRIPFGSPLDNLAEARRLFERAARSEGRRSDPVRAAITEDALGQTLRQLSQYPSPGGEARTELLQQAAVHHVEACRLADTAGPVGFPSAAQAYVSLGNTLRNLGDAQSAVQAFEYAVNFAESSPGPDPRPLALARIGLARALLGCRRPNVGRALALLRDVWQDAPTPEAATARLEWAAAIADHQPKRRKEAVAQLRRLNLTALSPERRRRLVELWMLLGEHDTARVILHQAMTEAWARRAPARADHVADAATAEIQTLAHLEARLHLDAGRPLDAFLALEHAAALRYGEVVSGYGWRAQDPIARELARLRDRCSATSVALDDLAARWAHAPVVDVARYASELVGTGPDELSALWAEARTAVEGLRSASSPLASLRWLAERFAQESARLSGLLVARDPSASPNSRPEGRHCEASTLERLLAELGEGTVLVHVHLGDAVLACAVWREGGVVTSRGCRLPVPEGLLAVLGSPKGDGLAGPLAELDLGDVLPASGEHLVILPSLVASLVPWAAAGPEGKTLLDRFGAISILPNLGPALVRQVVPRQRQGSLLVIPGMLPADCPTRFHAVAFAAEHADERRLRGLAATRANVVRSSEDRDVIALYAHGHRGGVHGGGIALADQELTVADFGGALIGCERVELWACNSGVNLPHDWLTPAVDEAFGLDVELHRVGVRTTVGSLWSVPDLVTALIVREYRRALERGASPPRALADAQRWWRREALPTLEQVLRQEPLSRWGEAMVRRLGHELPIDGWLGPVDAAGLPSAEDVQEALKTLAEPAAWAGFRFLGVAGRQPTIVEDAGELDEAGRAELRALLDASEEHLPFDQAFAEGLDAARALPEGQPPSREQAIRVARLYADRRPGVHRHNVLRGLAWVHEALADGDDPELRAEAAWLWLDLARGELPDERARILYPPDPFYLRRLESVMEGLDHPDSPVLRGWLQVLRAEEPDEMVARVRQVFDDAWAAASSRPVDVIEGLRARTAALELLLLVPSPEVPEGIDAVPTSPPLETAVAAARLQLVVARLLDRAIVVPPSLLSHRDLARGLRGAVETVDLARPESVAALQRALESHVGTIEGDHWGYAADDRVDLWLATGTPGRPWFDAVGLYLGHQISLRGDEAAAHVIASAHFGADLRLGAANAWVRAFGGRLGDAPPIPWWPARALGATLQQLEDAARLVPELPSGTGWADAFRHGLDALDSAVRAGTAAAFTFDQLSAALGDWLTETPRTRTAAFALERAASTFEEGVRDGAAFLAQCLREGPAELSTMLDQVREQLSPPLALAHVEDWVGKMDPDCVLLTMLPGTQGRLLAAAVGVRDGRRLGRTATSEILVESRARQLLAALVAPSEDRREAFAQLQSLLDNVLTRVLADFAGGPLPYLSVLAPGPLRGLPWSGLTLRGRPLRDLFSGIASLPHAGFERTLAAPLEAPPHTVCVLGVDEGEATPFGTAAVRTIRQAHGVGAVAEPRAPRGWSIDEVDVIVPQASRTRTLRFYGGPASATLNPTTEGLSLRGRRTLTTLNLVGTMFPVCEAVELWAPTGSRGEARSISDGDRDVMPSLVRAFLSAGAAGVLDLAWPVPDLVQALVYEQYAHLRAAEPTPGPLALRMALQVTAHRLESWARQFSDASRRVALKALDEARREDVRELGGDPSRVVPYATSAVVKDGPAAPLLAEVCEPVHLAAFRWWGP